MRDWQDISEWSDETSVWNAQFRRSALDLEYYCLVPSFCNYNQQAITKRTTLKIIVIYIYHHNILVQIFKHLKNKIKGTTCVDELKRFYKQIIQFVIVTYFHKYLHFRISLLCNLN